MATVPAPAKKLTRADHCRERFAKYLEGKQTIVLTMDETRAINRAKTRAEQIQILEARAPNGKGSVTEANFPIVKGVAVRTGLECFIKVRPPMTPEQRARSKEFSQFRKEMREEEEAFFRTLDASNLKKEPIMTTSKKPNIPVNKKIATTTKQVPAPARKSGTVSSTSKPPAKKAAPVKVQVHGAKKTASGPVATKNTVQLSKADSKAFHATKSVDEKTKIVAKAVLKDKGIVGKTANAIVKDVQQGVLAKANTAVAKANLVKAQVKEAAAKAVVKKIDAKIKALAPVKKVAAVKGIKPVQGKKMVPPKSAVKTMQVAVKKTGSDTKGYQIGTAAAQKAFDDKRNASIKVTTLKEAKEEPKKSTQTAALLTAKPSIVEPSKPAVNQYVPPVLPQNKFLPPAPAAAAPAVAALRIPAEMSKDDAIAREQLLRQTFRTLTATTHVGN